MINDTRSKILSTAQRLFNENGYRKVSLRKISDAIGISIGNLTYHFKKRDDILKALLENNLVELNTDKAKSLDDLRLHLLQMTKGIQANSFFFSDMSLQTMDDDLYEYNRNNVKKQKEILLKKVMDLRECGVIKKSVRDEDLRDIIEMEMLSHVTWAVNSWRKNTYTTMDEDSFISLSLRLFRPYLSKEGIRQLEAISDSK
ncbi:TetR/AcrR family transcriptional regulator [Butyrivibrio sp.]|uniref:TetR/AcrR family transcriptional regulator n=1 Tax=Butyrivibrio sp. TaxID=28121 RepID=UPI0025C2A0DD|nr:TetR/AcrR family transcriptional regulator [Butyrivibrio sp.]MBQ9304749.1 TetR/AcrR family transcriptional regulator [Butyrivibrio sp.]